MKRCKWIAILTLIIIGSFLSWGGWAMGDLRKPPTEDQKKAIAEMRARKERCQKGKCMDATVNVEIGDFVVTVRRYGSFIRLRSGEEINDLECRCADQVIENAQGVASGAWRLGDLSAHPDFLGTYGRDKAEIEQAEKEGRIEMLSNGIRKINRGAGELYILPLNDAPTANNEPVVFECNDTEVNRANFLTQRCYTTYRLPNGLGVTYDAVRKHLPVNGFLELDREKRRGIEAAIKSKPVSP